MATAPEVLLARHNQSSSMDDDVFRKVAPSQPQLCFDDFEALWQIKWEGEADAGVVYPDIGRRNSSALVTAMKALALKAVEDEDVLKPGPCEDFAEMGIPKYPAEWYWNV